MSGQAFSGDAERRRASPWDLGHPFGLMPSYWAKPIGGGQASRLARPQLFVCRGCFPAYPSRVHAQGSRSSGTKASGSRAGRVLGLRSECSEMPSLCFLVLGAEFLSSAIPGEEPGPRFSVPSGYGCEMYTKCFSYLPDMLFFGVVFRSGGTSHLQE